MKASVVTAVTALVLAIGVSSFIISPSHARNETEFILQSQGQDNPKSVPALLNYQGFLATADSGAVSETLAMTFRLYGSASGGSALWSETHPAVVVNNGGFTLHLGASHPIEVIGKGRRGPPTLREQTTLYGESRRRRLALPLFQWEEEKGISP